MTITLEIVLKFVSIPKFHFNKNSFRFTPSDKGDKRNFTTIE